MLVRGALVEVVETILGMIHNLQEMEGVVGEVGEVGEAKEEAVLLQLVVVEKWKSLSPQHWELHLSMVTTKWALRPVSASHFYEKKWN